MKNINHLKRKIDLKKLSHIKVGNYSDVYFPKDYEELGNIYRYFENKTPIGGGSNILFADKRDRVLVSDKKLPRKLIIKEKTVTVSCNYNINELIMILQKSNIGGLEFLAGIPANIGGLVFMNAGADKKSISDFVRSILIMEDSGDVNLYSKEQLKFYYRKSNIKGFILEVELDLDFDYNIINKVQLNISKRKKGQPLLEPNLGCFFKNPPNYSAGKLIDELGFKGFSVGDAVVSEKHANFIVNRGDAKFSDIIYLTNLIKEKVIKKYNIELKLEIKIV